MEKHKKLLILIISFFVLVLSFLLLKLEKKTVELPAYQTIAKNNDSDGDSLLQTYGAYLNETNPTHLQNNLNKPNLGYSVFLDTKIYSAIAVKPPVIYCAGDSSLSVSIYNKYGYSNTEDAKDNLSQTRSLTSVLLKYH